MAQTSGTTVDKTITFLLIGMFAVTFVFMTIMGMQRVEATAERARAEAAETEEVVETIDIGGPAK